MNIMPVEIVDRILDTSENALTSNEMNVYFFLYKIRDEKGYCHGVYWRDIADPLNMKKSSYYAALQALEEKKFIKREKNDKTDMDIFLIESDITNILKDLSDKKNKHKFINMNTAMFNDSEFYKLKANAKRLALMLLKRYTKENYGKLFYNPNQEFVVSADTDHLGVTLRSIKEYFESIKKWIGVSDERTVNKKVKHIITVLQEGLKRPQIVFTEKGSKQRMNKYREYEYHEHEIKTFCRRNKIDYDKQNLSDTAGLVKQYRKKFSNNENENIFTFVKRAIVDSMNENLDLQGRVINKILSNFVKNKYAEKESLEDPVLENKPVIDKNGEARSKNHNKFNNFPQRNYDIDELEKFLLGVED